MNPYEHVRLWTLVTGTLSTAALVGWYTGSAVLAAIVFAIALTLLAIRGPVDD